MPDSRLPPSLDALGLFAPAGEPAFDNLTALASDLVGVPVSLVSIIDPDEDRQVFKGATGLAEPWVTERQTPLSHSFCQHVRARGQPLVINDARQDPLVRTNLAIPDLHVIAYLGVPIQGPDGRPVGALCAIDSEPRSWTERDVDAMRRLALCVNDQIVLTSTLAISRQRVAALNAEIETRKQIEQELVRLATTDPLTGVKNRRAFMDHANALYETSAAPLSLAIIDVDHFKRVNDTLGHEAGDKVLVAVSQRISQAAAEHPDTLVARLGGEEFAVLIPGDCAGTGAAVAEAILDRVALEPVDSYTGVLVPVTVSIGLSERVPEDLSVNDLLRRADIALYDAKSEGRDRTRVHGDTTDR